jgi:probable rRNA maturation factor
MKFDKPININVRIVDDKEIQTLNKKYFDRDYPTDVLSFSLEEKSMDFPELPELFLGDIVVNKDQAQRQAKEYGNDFEHEIAALVEHGVLHLLGIHHPDDDEISIHGKKH